uniref:Uncharacterized protein n=1 Tax=Magallana gigas TaxID=29159 RepID=K1QJK3_MAGGI
MCRTGKKASSCLRCYHKIQDNRCPLCRGGGNEGLAQRKGEIMTCAELPPTTRLEGAKILIVARVSERTIDLRQFDLTKLLVQHTDLNCDSIQAKASTKVFLGEKMCSFDSTESRSHQKISTTTLIVETVAISFMLYILLRCIMLSSHPIPEPALATPREHQSEPGPVPALRRLRRVRRAPERLVY